MTKIGLIVAAVNAVIAVLVLTNVWELTAEAQAGIGLAVSAVLLAVAGFFDKSIPWGTTQPPSGP